MSHTSHGIARSSPDNQAVFYPSHACPSWEYVIWYTESMATNSNMVPYCLCLVDCSNGSCGIVIRYHLVNTVLETCLCMVVLVVIL